MAPPPPPPPSAAVAPPPDADAPAADADARLGQRWVVQWCLDGWHDAREAVAEMLGAEDYHVRPLDPQGPPLAEQCRGAHVLVPTTGRVDAACIAAALPSLALIAQPASATGNIDLAAAKQRGVPVTHAPGHNAAATAEIAVMLLLMLLRRPLEAPAAIAAREVGRPVGREARGRTLGVVGVTGRVGRRVARAAAALGMRVIGIDSKGARSELRPVGDDDDGDDVDEEEDDDDGSGGRGDQGRRQQRPSSAPRAVVAPSAAPSSDLDLSPFKRGLHALLEESDAVSLHIPLSAETEGAIGRDELSIMARRGALLVNTARAAVVDRAALEEALGPPADDGGGGGDGSRPRLRGAALDVMWEEPCDPADPLLRHPSCVVLPHLGCASEEAYLALAGVLVRNIRAAREGRWADLEHRVV
jgi:phosphoglycerate dehydrogenase-like enzyme